MVIPKVTDRENKRKKNKNKETTNTGEKANNVKTNNGSPVWRLSLSLATGVAYLDQAKGERESQGTPTQSDTR